MYVGRIFGQSSKNSFRFDKLATARATAAVATPTTVTTTGATTTTTTTIWLVNNIYNSYLI